MNYNPNFHHRRSIRLRGYDYSQAGLYFITIVSQNRECLFGEIENGQLLLNDAGKIANECWSDIPNHFPNARLHEYIIMPNHIHGIIEFVVGANNYSPVNDSFENIGANGNSNENNIWANDNLPLRSPSKTIGSVVRGFKIGVTKWFHQNTNIDTVWQRNYYEHIIRDEQSYQRIANYIENNPKHWSDDQINS